MIERRTFLGGMLASAAVPVFGVSEARVARVGLMTDTHVGETLESCSRVAAALRLFKAKGAEMVVNCGDIADRHYPKGYRFYRQVFNEIYPDAAARPKEVYVYAFHDVNNYKPGSGWNSAYAADAFADLQRLLEAPNGPTCEFTWKGLPFLVFSQATGQQGFPSWEDYEKAVARACAANPGKPVFVFDHVPPAGTTFHTRHWGVTASRRILNRYPQVVSIAGHVHGSLASERQIWQGEFTAVNVGCLQTWGGFAAGSTPPGQGKPNFGVLVMDVYADRLEFFRYDVRDGSSCGEPWVVPLPFASRTAPYRPEIAAKRQAIPSFADGETVAVTSSAAGVKVEFPEARQVADPFMYRIECARRAPGGGWTVFSRDDVFGDFWKAKTERTGRMSHTLDAAFFSAGETCRVTVTPLDCFSRGGRAISAEFTAKTGAGRPVWTVSDPLMELRFTEHGSPVEPTLGGRLAPSSGQGTLWLPERAFSSLEPGTGARLVLDLDASQPDGEWCAWRIALQTRKGANLREVQTAPGAPGTLRYVFAFTVPKEGLDTCDLVFRYASPGGAFRVAGLSLHRLSDF